MKTQIIIIFSLICSLFIAQTPYEKEMKKAIEEWKAADTITTLEKTAQHFERISNVEKENWVPLYYSILIPTFNAFSQDKKTAFESLEIIETKYESLAALEKNSEVLVLKALIQTVKVAKDPMTYGASLSGEIVSTYKEAIKLDPNNPRAYYFLAQYNINGSKYWGKDPKEYCPLLEKSVALFESEKKENFEPIWGKEQAISYYKSICSE